MRRVPLLFTLVVPLMAQQAGVIPEWEARRDIPTLPDKVRKILPILEQLQPQDWVAKGAPEAYVQQWKAAQTEVGYLQQTADALAQDPERLTLALDAYFRLQAIDTRLANLTDAIRKYQNPALADLFQSIAAETGTVRVGLQQYITEVATQRETEWRVMASEAQRCRTQLTAPPPPRKK